MDIMKLAKKYFDYTVQMRRHFHENPESGPEEQVETMASIEEQLEAMGIPYVQVPGGGIFGFIEGAKAGKTILLRADMDALPILEDENNLAGPKVCVSKKPGLMHGCGHDGHLAMLLTEAKILMALRQELKGSVILMFEEGEEGHGNIEAMCRYIQEKNLHFDGCHATHVRWDLPAGQVACCPEVAMSGIYTFQLELFGTSGHGSRPDLAHSTIDCFHEIYTALETLRLRYVRPDTGLTWSICSLHAGNRDNVIPEYLCCSGSIRLFDRACGAGFWEEFKRVLESVCALNYCTYKLTKILYWLPTPNDAKLREVYLKAVEKHVGAEAIGTCKPWMASESFSFLSNMVPGINTFTGIRDEAVGSGANHHTPQFDIAEQGLLTGVAAAVGFVVDYLDDPPDLSGFQPLCTNMEELITMLHEA